MKLKGNTILITGGSSGIGLELAKVLIKNENQVIICGRSMEKLEKAKQLIPSLQIFQCDLSKSVERKNFSDWIIKNYPQCNILVNNAAIVHKTDFLSDPDILNKAELEIQTNFSAPVELTKLLFLFLEKNKKSKIIFITSSLVYVPISIYPIYCATKSALHSFVQTLRIQTKVNSLNIYEVLMPPVDTPFHQGNTPKRAITPQKAVNEMLKNIEKEKKEIRIGVSKILYLMHRIAPSFIFNKLNTI